MRVSRLASEQALERYLRCDRSSMDRARNKKPAEGEIIETRFQMAGFHVESVCSHHKINTTDRQPCLMMMIIRERV